MAEAFRLQRGEAGTLALTGELGFATAAAALRALEAALRAGEGSRLDLAGVTACDSAGLACLLAVLATARGLGRPLALANVPDALRTLARVSDTEALLD